MALGINRVPLYFLTPEISERKWGPVAPASPQLQCCSVPKESAISVRARQKLGSGRPVPAERWRARGEHLRERGQQQESSGRTGQLKGKLWRGRHQRGEKGRGSGISSEGRRVGGAGGGATGARKRRDAHREEGVLLEGCGSGRLYRGGHDGTKGREQCLPSGLELRSSSLAEAEGVRSEGDGMGGSKEGSGGVDTGEEEGTRSGTAPEETLVGPTPGSEERRSQCRSL
ncbi:protein argonaute 18-like [Mustela erminea]|uniref:protein argonaute 18-like n=1 Tax=Mustela erminea TaxID=36723 RepID=UPI0013865F48|nr:protein argonaute 18-like [Mustela erminea]